MSIELNNEQIYTIYDLEHWWHRSTKQTFEISGAAGTGKAQPVDTLIPTPDGNKKLGNLKVGDMVFNRYGEPVKILGVFDQGKLDAYEIKFEDGRSTICNDEHLWTFYNNINNEEKTETLHYLAKQILFNKSYGYIYSIPMSKATECYEKKFDVIPYSLGTVLANTDVLSNNKRIPEEYFFGSIEQRWSLIKGLFDTKGKVNSHDSINYITYSSTNYSLINDIKQLLFSLGISSTVQKYIKISKNKNFISYTLTPNVSNEDKYNFFTYKDKIDMIDISIDNRYSDRLNIVSIEKLGYKTQMKCIYVDDPEHLYLTNDYIATHNTTLIRYFIERLGLKYNNVLFLAFMGKAASQMARKGLPAQTIHSAIYEYKEKMARDEEGHIILKGNGKPKLIPYFELRDHLSKKIKLIVVDEASMVDERMALDLLSFGIPTIALGDLNQLPPVFGNPFFLRQPDTILKQVMRQSEGNPIVWMSQQILNDNELKYGVYGNSSVIPKSDIDEFHFRKADIILTGTNRLRYNVNQYCREEIKGIKKLEYPHINEKVICKKNNWNECIGDNIYLTNGTTGFVDNIYRDSFNKRTIKIDFRPDFTKKVFKNIEIDYNFLYSIPGEEETSNKFSYFYDKFEYAYAITVWASQGSEFGNVLYMNENFSYDKEFNKKLQYTAITRASDSLIFVK